MKVGEIWICINRIGFDNVWHSVGDKVKIKELVYYETYNHRRHCYRVYVNDLQGQDKGFMMDWVFLKHFERVYN